MLSTYQVTQQITNTLSEPTCSEVLRRLRTSQHMLYACQQSGVLNHLLHFDDSSQLTNWQTGILGLRTISFLIPESSPDPLIWLTKTVQGRERLHNAYTDLYGGVHPPQSENTIDTLIRATESAVALNQELNQSNGEYTRILQEASTNPKLWRLPLTCLYGLTNTKNTFIEKILLEDKFALAELAIEILDSNETIDSQIQIVNHSLDKLSVNSCLQIAKAINNLSNPNLLPLQQSLMIDYSNELTSLTDENANLPELSDSISKHTTYSLLEIETNSEQSIGKLAKTLQASQDFTTRLSIVLGKAALKNQDAVSALAAFEQAKIFGGETSEISVLIAEAKVTLGMYTEAIEILSNMENQIPKGELVLARAYYQNGDLVLAAKTASSIISSLDTPSDLYELATILSDNHSHEEAIKALEKAIPSSKYPSYLLSKLSLELLEVGRIKDARTSAYESVSLDSTSLTNKEILAKTFEYEDEVVSANYEQALMQWENSLKIDPHNANVQLQYAKCALKSNEPKKARDELLKIIENNSIDASSVIEDRNYLGEAHTLLANSLIVLGEVETASSHFQKATQIAPQSPTPWIAIASFHSSQEEYDRAFSALKSGISCIDENNTKAKSDLLLEIGKLQLLTNDNEGAIKSLQESSHLQPDNSHIHHEYGKSLLNNQRHEEAIECLKFASQISPSKGLIWEDLGTAYEQNGDISSAIKSLQRAQTTGVDSEHLSKRIGLLALQTNEYDLSLTNLKTIVSNDSTDTNVLASYGYALEKTSKWDEAIEIYNKALDVSPNNIDLIVRLATCNVALNDYSSAIELLKPIAETNKDNIELQQITATAYINSKLWSEALPFLEQIIILSPDNTLFIKQTALALSKINKEQKAIELLHRASALDPDDANTHSDLSMLYQKSNRWIEAKKSAEIAISLDPSNAIFQKQLADCLSALGESQLAIDTLNTAITNDPTNIHILHSLGEAQYNAKQFKHAYESFIKASNTVQSNHKKNKTLKAIYLTRAGDALMSQQQKPQAISMWQKALLEDPENLELQKKLGKALMSQNRYEEASIAFENAIEHSNKSSTAILGAAEAAMASGEKHRAYRHLKNMGIDGLKDADDYYKAGLLHFQLNNYDAAIAALKISVDLEPDKALYRSMLARIFGLTNNILGATNEAEIALSHSTTDIDVLTNTGIALLHSQKHELALKSFYQAVDSIDVDAKSLLSIVTALIEHQEKKRLYEKKDYRSKEEKEIVSKCLDVLTNIGCDPLILQEWLARAQSLIGDVDTAIPALELVADQTSNPEVYCSLATSYRISGQMTKAEEYIRWILDRYPDHINAILEISNIYALNKDYENQIDWLKRAIELSNNNAVPHYMLGKAYLILNDLDHAIKSLEMAIKIEPGHSTWHFEIGRLYQETEKSETALSHFLQAVQLSKEQRIDNSLSLEYQIQLARSYFADGDFDAARTQYDEALTQNHLQDDLLTESGIVCMHQGDTKSALDRFEQALTLSPANIKALEGALEASRILNDTQKSESYALKLLKQSPDNAIALTTLAELYTLQGDTKNAMVSINHAIDNTTEPGPMILKKTNLLISSSKHAEALTYLKSHMDSLTTYHDAWETLGELNAQKGSIQDSIQAYSKAIELAPLHFHCHARIAELYIKNKDLDKAMVAIDKAMKLQNNDNENSILHELLGHIFTERQQYDRAYKSYSNSIRLTPNNAKLYLNAGLVLKKLKEYSEALSMFKKSVELDPKNVTAHRQLAAVSALGLISGETEI